MTPQRSADEREAMILRYLPLSRAEASRHRRRGVSTEDLEAEAAVALCEAVDAYDVACGLSLAVFARRRIRNALNRQVDHAPAYRMPRELERAARKCRAAKSALMADGNHRPTVREIADRAGLDVELALESLRTAPMPAGWIDQVGIRPVGAEDHAELLAVVEDGLALCPALGRRILELMGECDLTVGQAAYRLGVPYRAALAAYRAAEKALADHVRGRGYDESRYAAAIA